MWSPNELLKIEKQRDILSYITLQFFHFKKVPLEHCPLYCALLFGILFSFIILSGLQSISQDIRKTGRVLQDASGVFFQLRQDPLHGFFKFPIGRIME